MATTSRAAADLDAVSTGPDRSHRRRPTFDWRAALDAHVITCEWHGWQWESCKHCEADA